MARNEQYSLIKEVADDPFVDLCWKWRLLKIAFYGIGTIITFLYVIISSFIDKLS